VSDVNGFEIVERLLDRLVREGGTFASSTSPSYRVESYEPGWRLRIANVNSSRWIDVDDVRCCWETFERLRTIDREDVLEPGRASAFMLALFGQLPGVVEAPDGALSFA
jgi:hypothetical protein